MKINIYYGGRGMIDDPTLFVIEIMQSVLEELHVGVERFQLCEMKNRILTLPQTLKEADGVILATTVEWYGIGGYMQQFLDACWLYGDKEKIASLYMCPVVMSTTYGEREGKLNLASAWEILGGIPCSGLCGYISDMATLEMNANYRKLIEKKTENLYRTINQKYVSFPASNQAVKQKIALVKNFNLTPQETEQLSQYVSDDAYVKKQKEDIQELAGFYKGMMGESETSDVSGDTEKKFRGAFRPSAGVQALYRFRLRKSGKTCDVRVQNGEMRLSGETTAAPDVEINIEDETLQRIMNGDGNFQRSFMEGSMKMKGDFKIFRALDEIFVFGA